ncbi:MAG: hypothetical protein WD042_15345 [Phycisphaeraceae bacterium]
MMRVDLHNIQYAAGRAGQGYAWVRRQPRAPMRAAMLVGLLVLIVPVLMLVAAAVLAGAMVFGLIMLVLWLGSLPRRIVRGIVTGRDGPPTPWRGTSTADDGRRNVRVILRQ